MYLNVADNWGRTFYAGVLDVIKESGGSSEVYLHILARKSGQMTISSPDINLNSQFDVKVGQQTVQLPQSIVQGFSQPWLQKKGLKITSDVEIQVLVNVSSSTDQKFILFPLNPAAVTSTDYLVPCGRDKNIFIIAQKNSKINVSYRTAAGLQGLENRLVDEFDSYLVSADRVDSDLEFCRVSSTEPVTIFSSTFLNQQNYVEQGIPTSAWGYKYIIPSYPFLSATDFKAIASQDNTHLRISFGSQTVTMKLNSEQHIEPDIFKLRNSANSYLSSVYLLSSDKPIAVKHLGYADFSIPSLSQFGNDYWFYIPEEDKNDPLDKYVTIIVKQDEAGGLVFKGPLVPVFEFRKTVEFDGVEYLVASMEVLWSGFHRISHVSSAARFGGFVSGTSRYAGPIRYGYPFGLVLDTDKPGL